MGLLFYNLTIGTYNLLVLIFSSFNSKAGSLLQGRKRSFQTIKQCLHGNSKIIWFHCASLGEFEQGLPVMEAIKSSFPDYSLYVSFFSPSGYDAQKNNVLADCVFYLPTDTKSNANKMLDLLNPVAVFFIKYEFWYHYLKACNDRHIPVVSISTILRPDQIFFKSYGGFYRGILDMFYHFFVQNLETLKLLSGIGFTNATVSGDTRFDRVNTISKRHSRNNIIEEFKGRNSLVILGSTWKQDIDLWIPFLNQNRKLKYIIAPHNIKDEDIKYVEEKVTLPSIRYSQPESNLADISIIIIDNIGMLSSLYAYADIAYVGGAFGEGLHNVLEPATYGKPVIVGKSKTNKKYQEVIALIKDGGAYEVFNSRELEHLMHDFLFDDAFYNRASDASKAYVQKNLGSTDIIMDKLKSILS